MVYGWNHNQHELTRIVPEYIFCFWMYKTILDYLKAQDFENCDFYRA